MADYEFKYSLHLHAKETIHRDYEGGEVMTLPETSLQLINLFLLILCLKALLWLIFLVRKGVSVHDAHVVHNVHPSL